MGLSVRSKYRCKFVQEENERTRKLWQFHDISPIQLGYIVLKDKRVYIGLFVSEVGV